MSYRIIDRRKSDKGKSTVNRQRFVKRARRQLLPGVRESIKDMNIKDIGSKGTKRVKVPIKNLDEPDFSNDRKKGDKDYIVPGNDKWRAGDTIKKPTGEDADGMGRGGSPDGEGEDEFVFNLSRDEFLDLFFEDLELPNIAKNKLTLLEEKKLERDGFRDKGSPSTLDIIQTFRQSKIRKSGQKAPLKRKLKKLQEELLMVVNRIMYHELRGERTEDLQARKIELEREISKLKARIEGIAFIDTNDLKYRAWDEKDIPTFQAVMFCIMDVSGSMTEERKRISKIFFMLLYLFLQRNYERVDIIFIRHHSEAQEVKEEQFFYDTETGGTVVSTALELLKQIIDERYSPAQWNIYCAHSSDGENWHTDNENVHKLLDTKILPICQHFAYLDVGDDSGDENSLAYNFGNFTYVRLWDVFKSLAKKHDNIDFVATNDRTRVYDVFRKLFERKSTIRVN